MLFGFLFLGIVVLVQLRLVFGHIGAPGQTTAFTFAVAFGTGAGASTFARATVVLVGTTKGAAFTQLHAAVALQVANVLGVPLLSPRPPGG